MPIVIKDPEEPWESLNPSSDTSDKGPEPCNHPGVCPGKVIAIAAAELGYGAKNSRDERYLYDKYTDNDDTTGEGDFTKYAKWLHEAGYYQGDKNGFDWCTIFVDWVILEACGSKEKADYVQCVSNLYGAGVGQSKAHYRAAGRLYYSDPKPGDEIFFGDYHTGIVYKVDDDYVYTIEGNTKASGSPRRCVASQYYKKSRGDLSYGRPRYDVFEDDPYIPPFDPGSQGSSTGNTGPNAYDNAYGVTYLPFEYLDESKLYQYVVTLDRNSPSIQWRDLREQRISAAVIEAGYLFNSAHVKQRIFKSPKFYEQMHAADEADVPIGLWMTCRAQTEDEAIAEMRELQNCIQVAKVAAGVWLHLKLTQSLSKNNRIVRIYKDKLHELGLHRKIGFYVTKNELKRITWEDHADDWYLWLVDHVSEDCIDLIDDLLTPEFFQIERSEDKKDWVVDKQQLQADFGSTQLALPGTIRDPNISSSFGEQLEYAGGRYVKTHKCMSIDYSLQYALFLPKVVRENMPLVCWLHGDFEAGEIDKLTWWLGMIKAVKDVYGEEFPFIFVCPCRPKSLFWKNEKNTVCVKSLLDTVARMYKCNTDKIIISGHSGGALGCWEMVHDYGDFFSAAVPVSCTSGSEINDKMLSIPIWTFAGNIGTLERSYNTGMKQNVDSINSLGGNARHTTLDTDHGGAGSEAYTQDTFNWMLSQ